MSLYITDVVTSKSVRILNGVPGSPLNANRFVGSELLPDAFNSGRMTGRYVATHSADLIRLPLLFLYGGAWFDVGSILLGNLEDIWITLEDPLSSYEFAAFVYPCRPKEFSIINTWMMARRGCLMVKYWHDTFVKVWGSSTECEGMSKHPLLRHLTPYKTPTDELNCHEISIEAAKIMDYGAQVLCLERLLNLVDSKTGWDGRACADKTVYLLPALTEMWYYQQRTEFLGSKQFKLLNTPYDGPEADRRLAKAFVQDMLGNTLMMKFCHGPKDVMESSLADLWDDPKNSGADSTPGTFAEYLRWGSFHLRQVRVLEPVKLNALSDEPYHVGLFGAIEQ